MTPVQSINHGYSDKEHEDAYGEITRATLDVSLMESALHRYWLMFVPYALPAPSDHENDVVKWVQDRFDTLYARATLWYNEHRFKDVYARLAALEEHVGLEDAS